LRIPRAGLGQPEEARALPVLPLLPPVRLSPAHAGAIAKRSRRLLRRGKLTHRQFALLDTLLWSCRRPGSGVAVASYSALQKLVRIARETLAEGLRQLEALGLLSKVKRRVRVAWHNGGQQSQQAMNAYVLHAPADTSAEHSEFAGRTVPTEIEITHRVEPSPAAVAAAREALARRRRSLEEQWLRRKRGGGMAEV
jgi:hypothetical protein